MVSNGSCALVITFSLLKNKIPWILQLIAKKKQEYINALLAFSSELYPYVLVPLFIRSIFYNVLYCSIPSVPGRTRRFGILVRLQSPARGCKAARPDYESEHGSQPPEWSHLWRQQQKTTLSQDVCILRH